MKKTAALYSLMWTFMKIGLFTFGGGYALIAMMRSVLVDKKKWITHEEMMDITILAESTPGPISVNCATYIGYRQAGFLGAALTTTAFILPSFTILYLISLFFNDLLEITVIANAFKGIKIAVGVLILNVGIGMVQKMKKTPLTFIVMSSALAASLLINFFGWSFSTIYMILIAGLIGYFAFLFDQLKSRNEGAS